MKIAVLGAGISGLTCALKLQEEGFTDISILEKDAISGGLAKSAVIDGYTYDLHGGHVFNSRYDEIKDWVFSILPRKYWKYQRRNARILYKNKIIDYPFEFSLSKIDVEEAMDCLADFVAPKKLKKPDNYYDWLRWRFGDAIAFKYMIPYNEKVWGCDLKRMGIDWVESKMPLPSTEEVMAATLRNDVKENKMPHAFFYYPLKGGIQSFINAMAEKFRGKLYNNYEVQCVEKVKKKFIVNGQDKYDRIISTICVKKLLEYFKATPRSVTKTAKSLHNGFITTILCKCPKNDMSWLYVPDRENIIHRLVFQGNFSPYNCPKGEGSSVVLETADKRSPEEIVKIFNKNMRLKKLKVNDIISSSLTQAYILYGRHHEAKMKQINNFLAKCGIYCVGRFAERKYYNMDICMKSAFDMARRIAFEHKNG